MSRLDTSDVEQEAPLSQRDRAAGLVSYGQKWKTNWETIFYVHYRSAFNHCDVIGQQNKDYYAAEVIQGHRDRYQSKACMRLPISD